MNEISARANRRFWLIGLIAIILTNVLYPIFALRYWDWNLATIMFIYYLEFGISIGFALLKVPFCDMSGVTSNGKPVGNSWFSRLSTTVFIGFVYLVFYAVAGVFVVGHFEFSTIKSNEIGFPLLAFAAIELYRAVLFFRNKDYQRYGKYSTGRVIFKPHIKLMLVTGLFAAMQDELSDSSDESFFWLFVAIKILVDILADYVENAPPPQDSLTNELPY